MIEQRGRVVAATAGRAWVRLGGQNGCARCDAGRGCGAGIFGRLLRGRSVVLEMDNAIDAGNGQPVVVGLPESWLLRLAGRFYLLPLLAGLGGAVIGHYLGTVSAKDPAVVDIWALLVGLAAGVIAVWRNRHWSREFSRPSMVHLIRVAGGHEQNPESEEYP